MWPGLSKDVGLWTRFCIRCQQSKIQSHAKSSVPRVPVPGRRFFHMHLDLVGPLPSSQRFSYLLMVIDRTSRWPEAVSLSSVTSEACARAFISTLVSRFGVPALLTLDRKFPVYILRLVGGLFHLWNFENYDYQFSSPEQWND